MNKQANGIDSRLAPDAAVQLRLTLCTVARSNDGFASMKYPQGGTLTPTPTPTATRCGLAWVEQVRVPYPAFGMFVANDGTVAYANRE
jgi:hypothetical protein